MPEIITTPHALVQTTNGKRFYVFSAPINVTSSETTMIDIDNIGERDIKLHLEIGPATTSSSVFTLKIKSNGSTIYNEANADSAIRVQNDYRFILPANTSLAVTLKSSSASVVWTVACYGKYLSM